MVLVPALALASDDAGHGLNWKDFAFRCVNFAIFAFLIYKLAGKRIGGFFRDRKLSIESQLSDLEARKLEAEKSLKDVEASIANLASEREKILSDYKAQGEAQASAIITAAQKQAAQMKEQAGRSASHEARAAMDAIKAELAVAVVDAAAKMVQDKLTQSDQEKLIDEYLDKVVIN